MKVNPTPIAGLAVIELDAHADSRGFFIERFNAKQFAACGLPTAFVQDNHSRSLPGVLRGLHYQHTPAQGKLVGVMRGRILDVAVDIRPNSPTFGQHFALELSDENNLLFWVPGGFAHGFCVLGDAPADVFYKVDAYYNQGGEGGIRFDDSELAIAWPLKNPFVIERDLQLQAWRDYCASPPAWGSA
jgi:dTDP-4-dehydrorhamnose 3,5-epimerase